MMSTFLAITAAVATVLALFVAVYFGKRSLRRRELEVRHLAGLSIMDAGTVGGSGVELSHKGKSLSQLSKVRCRLSNIGNVPVEGRDIERPLTLVFDKASVLEGTVVERDPESLKVELQTDSQANRATLDHGLMNPGDFVTVEILLDGPVEWPRVECRISGVPKPIVAPVNDRARRAQATYPALPRSIQYVSLVIAMILSIGLVVGAVVLGANSWQPIPDWGAEANWIVEISSGLTPGDPHDQEPLSVEDALSLQQILATRMERFLPSEIGADASHIIRKASPQDQESARAYLRRISQLLRQDLLWEPVGLWDRVTNIKWPSLVAALFGFVAATFVAVVALGGFRNLRRLA